MEIIQAATSSLQYGIEHMQCEGSYDVAVMISLTETFRTLRNTCANCKEIQHLIGSQQNIISLTRQLLEQISFLSSDNVDMLVMLRCCVQFLGNMSVNHIENKRLVWTTFHTTFLRFLRSADNKLIDYTCMVMHTCLCDLGHSDLRQVIQDNSSLLRQVLEVMQKEHAEWGLYLIEVCLQCDTFWKHLMDDLSPNNKLFVLDVVLHQLKEGGKETIDRPLVSCDFLHCVVRDFVQMCSTILMLAKPHVEQDDVASLMPLRELEILCQSTGQSSTYMGLRNEPDLLTTSVLLLKSLHDVGQAGTNAFSSAQKMSDLCAVDTTHPVFGLKKDLVRLIGNMCHKHRQNQDLVRNLDGIPLILELTNIDAKNPYMTQWCILAIHNLCEDNNECKAVLVEMKMHGLADNVGILQEFGVDAELQGDKIVVKPSR